MARSTIKALENLPGTDEYGLFFIEKVGCTKNGGLHVNVRYDGARGGSATYWYYNANGSMYKNNPDGSATYRSPSGSVIHKYPMSSRTATEVTLVSPINHRPGNASLPCRASGVLFFGWPLIMIYPGRFLLTVSFNIVFLILMLSVCALFSQRNHAPELYEFPHVI